MASTQDRVGGQPRSLLPDPVPAHLLGQDTLPVPQQNQLPKIWQPHSPRLLILAMLLLLGIGGGILTLALRSSQVTITIIPKHLIQTQNITVSAITGRTTGPGQIQARAISSIATKQTPTSVATTGVKNVPELVARGQITFYNALDTQQTVNAYTVLTANNGIQVKTLVQAVIPPASGNLMGYTAVAAQATQPGSVGNIVVHALTVNIGPNGSILVRNETAFTGGQDAENYRYVQQSDVDHAAAGLQPQVLQTAKNSLASQIKHEDIVVAQQCSMNTQEMPAVGSKSATVTVTVTVICHEEAYDSTAAQSQAAMLYRDSTIAKISSTYALFGQASFSSPQVVNQGQGTLTISYSISGKWLYQIDKNSIQQLLPQLLGKSWTTVQAILLRQPGVAAASFTGTGNTLPTNKDQIQIRMGS